MHESFAIEAPIFIVRQADSPVSLEFPIRAIHATKVSIVPTKKKHKRRRKQQRKTARKERKEREAKKEAEKERQKIRRPKERESTGVVKKAEEKARKTRNKQAKNVRFLGGNSLFCFLKRRTERKHKTQKGGFMSK